MQRLIKFLILIFICLIVNFTFDVIKFTYQMNDDSYFHRNKEVISKANVDYIQWATCIELSDGSDSSCEECDMLYNSNNEFDMKDMSDYKKKLNNKQ